MGSEYFPRTRKILDEMSVALADRDADRMEELSIEYDKVAEVEFFGYNNNESIIILAELTDRLVHLQSMVAGFDMRGVN